MEWEARKLLYQLVDTVVDMSSHKEVLNILLPAKDLDCEDWQEIEIPVRPRSSEEQDSLHQILDELDNRTAKTTTPVETTKQKPCKGRKKKQLQAGRGEQHKTSIFWNVHKPLEQSQNCQSDVAWEDVNICS